MKTRPLYQALASAIVAYHNCCGSDNHVWRDKHLATILDLCKNHMPSGSGFDDGVKVLIEQSGCNRLVFNFAYHHMNSAGFYTHWSPHRVVVRPNLLFGITISITGPGSRSDFGDYVVEIIHAALTQQVPA